MNFILVWDNWIFNRINLYLRKPVFDILMPRITHVGGARISIVICIVLLLCQRWLEDVGFKAVYALAGSHLIVQIVKRFITRPRPYLVLNNVNLWESLALKDYSFPSGHTTAAFSIATVLAIHFPLLSPLIMFIATMVGFSRIYLGLHYPTDVGIGAVLGILSAALVTI